MCTERRNYCCDKLFTGRDSHNALVVYTLKESMFLQGYIKPISLFCAFNFEQNCQISYHLKIPFVRYDLFKQPMFFRKSSITRFLSPGTRVFWRHFLSGPISRIYRCKDSMETVKIQYLVQAYLSKSIFDTKLPICLNADVGPSSNLERNN